MKALTLWQPWASLVADNFKTTETRSWHPHSRLEIGETFAIHAGKRKVRINEFTLEEQAMLGDALGYHWEVRMPYGCIVATARLVGVEHVRTDQLNVPVIRSGSLPERINQVFGDFTPGRYMWHLDQIELLHPPIAASGNQGIWNLPDRVVKVITNRRSGEIFDE